MNESRQADRRSAAIFWAVFMLALLLPRLLLQDALPVYLFSDDSHSYLLPAYHWTQTGEWETSSRRGALYSLLIAGSLDLFGNLNALVPLQHVIGAVSLLLVAAFFRAAIPRRLIWPGLAAAVALAVCSYAIYLENLVRSEILLLLFASIALTAWGWFLLRGWNLMLVLAGAGFALATLVKNLLLPFPLVVGLFLCLDKSASWQVKMRRLALLSMGILLPFAGEQAFYLIAGHRPAPAPQSGILLFGRVAQWTVLDGGTQLEIKALIRADIEAYRKLPRLNNNVILKRTAVPKIYRWVKEKKGSEADVNRICRELAVEAIRASFPRWLEQIGNDLVRLHWKMNFPRGNPTADDLADARLSTSKMKHQHPMLRQPEVLSFLGRPGLDADLRPFHAVTSASWLFLWRPVLLTSIFLPLLIWLDRDAMRRRFWIIAAAIWFFDVAIICTVGRPIPRYLSGALPIMFWVQAGAFLQALTLLVRSLKRRQPPSDPLPL